MTPRHKWLALMVMLATACACLWRVCAPRPSPAPAAMMRSMERGDESAAQRGGEDHEGDTLASMAGLVFGGDWN